jgi:hypothetical protein
MDSTARELQAAHAAYQPLDQRIEELLAGIRLACAKPADESYDRANERLVEQFIAQLKVEFPGRTFEVTRGPRAEPFGPEDAARWEQARRHTNEPCVVIERQRLSRWALRTTRWNYLFTVPGESAQRAILVAHYDTWRGPGADDNTTGEEILKQYLLTELRAARRPALTHTFFLAGSEECGLVGMMSQILLACGLLAANFALAYRSWISFAIALALCPLASYRFGVSGSREYVRTLTDAERRAIRAVVAIDSVGEGRMYILRSTLGADFIHALIPFGDYGSLTDLLEEGAHLHGVKYNNYLSGGTTDHVSFLEINNGLWLRLRDAVRRVSARVLGRPFRLPFRIPATALVAMTPGKASPLVYGGKIHTPHDVPERVYPGPLRETLEVLDYLLHRLEGAPRMREPRTLDEYHYARLYRAGSRYYVVLKDAIEPNRRNLNGAYRATVTVQGSHAVARVGEIVGWGVEPRLRDQARDVSAAIGDAPWERVAIEDLTVTADDVSLHFERRRTFRHYIERMARRAVSAVERAMGRWSFLAFFGVAYAIAEIGGWVVYAGLRMSPAFFAWFVNHEVFVIAAIIAVQLAATLLFIVRLIPTWIDNSYRHENRADNLGSLRRVPLSAPAL